MNLIKTISGLINKNNKTAETNIMAIKRLEEIIKKREEISGKEFEKGYNLIKKYPFSVSILGSARFKEDNEYYKKAQSLAYKIVKELNYSIVTGGGPGIMEAANRGALEAGGNSLGFSIKLPNEQRNNKYLTEYAEFEYFSTRKTLLFFSAETFVFFPGGFGTLDELFEILTMTQTQKMTKTPVILVGKEFWTPFLNLFKELLAEKYHTIDLSDTEIYKIVDSEDEIINIIKNAPRIEEKV